MRLPVPPVIDPLVKRLDNYANYAKTGRLSVMLDTTPKTRDGDPFSVRVKPRDG